jgi:uncharacterized repeat protein (TIGR01451 family)
MLSGWNNTVTQLRHDYTEWLKRRFRPSLHRRSKRHYATVGFWLLTVILSTSAAQAASNALSIHIFRDFNFDGRYDTDLDSNGAFNSVTDESGVNGIGIRIFQADSALPVLTGTTAAHPGAAPAGTHDQGWLVIPAASLPAGVERFRIEVDTGSIQTLGYQPGPVVDTSAAVQWVDLSVADPQLRIGVHRPPQFCQSNPPLLTSCFVQGQQANDTRDTLVGWDRFNTTGDPALDNKGRNRYFAQNQETGSITGLAYRQQSSHVFAAAYAKRHTGYGVGGPGAIYVVDVDTGNASGNVVATIQIPNPGATPRGIDATTFAAGENCANPGNAAIAWDYDSCSFDLPGKEGLGDVEISDDGNTLWTINLNTRHLFRIDVSDPLNPGTPQDLGAIADPGCPGSEDLDNDGNRGEFENGEASDWRPFALNYHLGALFVGGVCSGETGNTDPVRFDPNVDADGNNDWTDIAFGTTDTTADLRARVLRFNDPHSGTAYVSLLDQTIDFNRGRAASDSCGAAGRWHGWVGRYHRDLFYQNGPVRAGETTPNSCRGNNLDHMYYPQPMLSGIEFDRDGSLILAFRDRFGDQTADDTAKSPGLGNPGDPVDTDNQIEGFPAGDINRACAVDAPIDPTTATAADWQWEGTGACPTHGNSPSEPDLPNDEWTLEYYFNDFLELIHEELAIGHVAFAPRFQDVVTAMWNPLATNTFGVRYLDNAGGSSIGAYEIGSGGGAVTRKGANIGDVLLLCGPAPIQLGDLIWLDSDEDGVQDPDEQPLAGVTVYLLDAGGNPVRDANNEPVSALSDMNGHYYFGALDPSTLNAAVNNGADVLIQPNTGYRIAFDITTATNLPAGVAAADLRPTRANSTLEGGNDGNDSDVDATATFDPGTGSLTLPVLALNTGTPGQDNHNADFGVVAGFDLALTKTPAVLSANPGDTVAFVFNVINQGSTAAYNIEITDYLPAGLLFDATLNTAAQTGNPGDWVVSNANPSLTIPGPLAANGGSLTLTLNLRVAADAVAGALVNGAEISAADNDTDPTNTAPVDIDSTPDLINGNDAGGAPGSAADNAVDGDGSGLPGGSDAATDEDDHDVARITVNAGPLPPPASFDLALIKRSTATTPARPGESATFTITVFNQGTVAARSIVITDYIPNGMRLSDADWTDNGDGTATLSTPIDSLAAGASTTVEITLTIDADFQGTQLVNIAEISAADDDADPTNTPPQDIDSTADTDAGNDPGGEPGGATDNTINNENGDEDDHDPAVLSVSAIPTIPTLSVGSMLLMLLSLLGIGGWTSHRRLLSGKFL